MKQNLVAALAGALFGLGLAISQMVNPAKVLNFLDVAGHWDPTLLLVMGGAVAVTLPGFAWVLKMPRPLLVEKFHVPTRKDIDAPLVTGAVLFGAGWGLSGLCPAPALVAGLTGFAGILVFVVAMLAGMLLHGRLRG